MTMSPEQELVVVTGASAGLGAATAQELARRGFHVLAGVRREADADAVRADRIEPVMLDVTDAEHIEALAARVAGDPRRRPLRAVVNNAGTGAFGAVETVPIGELRHAYDVNVFGPIAVTQALLPALRRGAGRVVTISSVAGKVALPGWSPYAGTKFALEAVHDSLRREVTRSGVRVIVVEPGYIRTGSLDRGVTSLDRRAAGLAPELRELYGDLTQAVGAQLAAATAGATPPPVAARVIARAVTDRRPRARYTVGRDGALFTFLPRIVPDRLLDRLLAAGLRPYFPKP
ncbi:SDR family NAD(P)-dependent oxidoreductase [Actinoplanes sp. URMC 104]|uniref:SDR family NAD(P)-dependent oxidoreductase n=1 Tax=Actinoplanes sp. URMC 104 TaxID=3423409 RepID=UPI003F1AD8F3